MNQPALSNLARYIRNLPLLVRDEAQQQVLRNLIDQFPRLRQLVQGQCVGFSKEEVQRYASTVAHHAQMPQIEVNIVRTITEMYCFDIQEQMTGLFIIGDANAVVVQ